MSRLTEVRPMAKRYILATVRFNIHRPKEIAVPAEQVKWISGFEPSIAERVKPRVPDSSDMATTIEEQTSLKVKASELNLRSVSVKGEDIVTGDVQYLFNQSSISISNIYYMQDIVNDSVPGLSSVQDTSEVSVVVKGPGDGPRPFAHSPLIVEADVPPSTSREVKNNIRSLETAIRDSTDILADVILSDNMLKVNTNDGDLFFNQIFNVRSHITTFLRNRDTKVRGIYVTADGEAFR